MTRDLDEIEMEMGKERTMKVGDRVRTIDGKMGEIKCSNYPIASLWIPAEKRWREYLEWQLECIPVEPERVKGRCVYSYCSHKSDGPNWCAGCEYWVSGSFPSPGLLQRMGMATWDDAGWFVVLYEPTRKGAKMLVTTDLGLKTEQEARSWVREGPNRRAFRWQDGLR
ncbi:MAG: hypothetical protein WC455_18895 [Dehalococcoidia bacterium]|jgi:hypothetical protein